MIDDYWWGGTVVWDATPKLFGSINTMVIELFNKHCVALTKIDTTIAIIVVAATGVQGGGSF